MGSYSHMAVGAKPSDIDDLCQKFFNEILHRTGEEKHYQNYILEPRRNVMMANELQPAFGKVPEDAR
jgi:hypothetical protein